MIFSAAKLVPARNGTATKLLANPAQMWIDRCLARLRLGQFAQRGAEWFAIYLFVLGSAILAARLFWPTAWPHVLWISAGAIPVAWGAWWQVRKEAFSKREATAWLDRQLDAGGLLMTLAETPDARWAEQLPQLDAVWRESLPKWSPVRSARYLSLPVLFTVGACLVPLRDVQSATAPEPTLGQQQAQQLEELLKSLDEAQVLREEEKQQLQEEIQKLAEDVEHNALTHEKWETIDALREKLQLRMDESTLSVSKAAQAAGLLSQALRSEKNLLTEEQSAQLENELLETLRKLAEKGGLSQAGAKSANSKLPGDLQRLLKNGQFRLSQDPGERQQCLSELADLLDEEAKKLSECRKKCEGCKGGRCAGQCDGDGNRPGQGGISRGRGDAELTWGDDASLDGIKFKEMTLPEGFLEDPKDKVEGVSVSAPQVEPAEAAPRGAAKKVDAATGNETWNRSLSPRHRNVVRQYFQQ